MHTPPPPQFEQRVPAPFTTDESAVTVGLALRKKKPGYGAKAATIDLLEVFVAQCLKTLGGYPAHPSDPTRSTGHLATHLIEAAVQWHQLGEPDEIPKGTAQAALITAVRLMTTWNIPYAGPAAEPDEWSEIYGSSFLIVNAVIAHEPLLPRHEFAGTALLQVWDLSYDLMSPEIEDGTFDILGDLTFPSHNAACSALLRRAEIYAKTGKFGRKDAAFVLRTISLLHYEWGLDQAIAAGSEAAGENLSILEPEAPPESEVLSPQPLPPEPAILEQPGSYVDPLEEIGVFEEFADSGKPRKKGRR